MCILCKYFKKDLLLLLPIDVTLESCRYSVPTMPCFTSTGVSIAVEINIVTLSFHIGFHSNTSQRILNYMYRHVLNTPAKPLSVSPYAGVN